MSNYFRKLGDAMDRFLNVLCTDGHLDETISHHAAIEAQKGQRWACVLCRWLSWTVETDHCAKVLVDGSVVKAGAATRAGIQLVVVFLIVTFGLWFWLRWT